MSYATPISLGRARALQTAATAGGIFTILAIDHRDSMRVLLNAAEPEAVSAARLTEIKLAILEAIGERASATLIDPVYGLPQAIAARALPGKMGIITSLETQGYEGGDFGRVTTLLDNWGPEKAKRLGASGVKILLYYHPDSAEAAAQQETLVQGVLAECGRYEIPLFLEPIGYPLNAAVDKRSAAFAQQRPHIVVESARRFSQMGADVLKVEFPVDCQHEREEAVWQAACAKLDAAITVPWALLSAGDPFAVFKQQLRVACEHGCSGFLVGRALWREVMELEGAALAAFLRGEMVERWEELASIATEFGRPWHAAYQMPAVDDSFYRLY